MEDQHVYHHYDGNNVTRINVKVEKNSRGYNWEVTATGAVSVDEALELVRDASEKLRAEYGE